MHHKLAVLGDPIQHSRSPELHLGFAKDAGIDISYERIQSKAVELPDRLERLIHDGYIGVNLTHPLKVAGFEWAKQTWGIKDAQLENIGAINTLCFRTKRAFNTDGRGLLADLSDKNISLTKKNILILGAGGAVKGTISDILSASPKRAYVLNRTPIKATRLVNHFDHEALCTYPESTMDVPFDIIFNMASEAPISLPCELKFAENLIAYDLNYGARAQSFKSLIRAITGQQKLSVVINTGEGMLRAQAKQSFDHWFLDIIQK